MLVDQPLIGMDGAQVSSNQLVRTASITVQNIGLLPAKGVEVTFNWKPHILNLAPARAFEEATSAFNRYSLQFDSFAPGELVTIDIMAINAELPLMTAVRSDDCVAKMINMGPQRIWPMWFNNLAAVAALLGIVTALNLVVGLLRFIVR